MTGSRSQIREVSGGGGYLSQSSLTLGFGLGASASADSVIVSWPSGIVERYHSVPGDRRILLTELDATTVEPASDATGPALAFETRGPNPARGDILFRAALPRRTRVRILAFDVRGRRIAVIADAMWDAGWHPVTRSGRDLDGRRVAAGAYLVRFEALGEIRTRKIMILR